jgi:hypothetical protein
MNNNANKFKIFISFPGTMDIKEFNIFIEFSRDFYHDLIKIKYYSKDEKCQHLHIFSRHGLFWREIKKEMLKLKKNQILKYNNKSKIKSILDVICKNYDYREDRHVRIKNCKQVT